jgi:hypothetical protein
MPAPSPSRPHLRRAVLAALIFLAFGADAATGFNLTIAAGCVTFLVVQVIAMAASTALIVSGLVVWIFSRLRSERAFAFAVGGLALAVAAMLSKQVFVLIGLSCIG